LTGVQALPSARQAPKSVPSPPSASTNKLRDADVLVQLGNIFLAAFLLRQLIVFFRVLPAGLYDFNIFRNAGLAVLHGQSPFSVDGYIYPATAAVAFIPFAAVSFTVGGSIFAVLIVLSLVAALRILGIRDWRCYAVVIVSMPGWTSVTTGTLSGVCALLAAMVYRYRDDGWRSAGALTAGLVTKVFLWPLGVWLVSTRRARAVALSVALTLSLLLVSLLVIGASHFTDYHDSVRQARHLAEASYSPFALLRSLGLASAGATLVVALIGLSIIAASWFLRDERLTFSLAVFAALVMSPVIWIHYLVLVYVPIAIARPRLSPLWFLPLLYVPIGLRAHADGSIIRIGLVLALTTLTFCFVARACRQSWQEDPRSSARAGRRSIDPHAQPVSQN
jgi:Glycosyltransferase family 87